MHQDDTAPQRPRRSQPRKWHYGNLFQIMDERLRKRDGVLELPEGDDESILAHTPLLLPPRPDDGTRAVRRRPHWVRVVEYYFALLRPSYFIPQFLALLFFVAIVFVPAFLPDPPENATPFDNFTEFSIYVMWGLWFPIVLVSVLFSGRSWCGLFCPQGATSEWVNRFGLQKEPPAWMRWEGTPIASFVLITVLGQTLGVRDHPEAILELFGGTMIAAAIVGFLYGQRQRVWCRHLCPIGLLLGIFSRLGAVYFGYTHKRPGGDRYCSKCLCPTMVDIRYKEESRHCIVCFRCVTPGARHGMLFHIRRPGEEVENIHDYHPNLPEVIFLFVGTGIALGGFLWLVLPTYQELRQSLGLWFFEHNQFWVGDSGPAWLMSVHPQRGEVYRWIDFLSIVGFMLTVMAGLTALLGAATALSAWLSTRLGTQKNFRRTFVELGYPYAPVAMISLILGLGAELFKSLTWIGMDATGIGLVKLGIFYLALLWSIFIGERILASQHVPWRWRWLPLLPCLAGCLLVGFAWKTAIF